MCDWIDRSEPATVASEHENDLAAQNGLIETEEFITPFSPFTEVVATAFKTTDGPFKDKLELTRTERRIEALEPRTDAEDTEKVEVTPIREFTESELPMKELRRTETELAKIDSAETEVRCTF